MGGTYSPKGSTRSSPLMFGTLMKFSSKELPLVLPIMLPLLVRGLGQYCLNLVSMGFVNAHAPSHLAGVTLGMSLTTMLGWAAISGQSSALATLTSQAHGAQSHDGASASASAPDAYVNVAAFTHVLWTLVPLGLLPLVHSGLVAMGQDAQVVSDATAYFGVSILSLPFYAVFVSYRRYLDSLLQPWPGALLCGLAAVALPMLLPFANLFVAAEHAPPAAMVLLFAMCAAAMPLRTGPLRNMGTIPSGRKVRQYLALSIPSMLSMMAEWWSTEVLVIAGGRINAASLTANAVCNTLLTFLYQISYAVSCSCAVRVGFWLGAGHPKRAQQTILLHILFTLFCSSVVAMPLFLNREGVSYLLVGQLDQTTVSLTVSLIPLVTVFFLIGSVQCVLYGALCGAGLQHISLLNTLIGYWPLGVPLALYYGFSQGMGVVGFWHGLLVCSDLCPNFLSPTMTNMGTHWGRGVSWAYIAEN